MVKWLIFSFILAATAVVAILVLPPSSKPDNNPAPAFKPATDRTSVIYRLNENQIALVNDKQLESITTTLNNVVAEGKTAAVKRADYYEAIRIVGKDYCEGLKPTITREVELLKEPAWPDETANEVQALLDLDNGLLSKIEKCSTAPNGMATGKSLDRFQELATKITPTIKALNKAYVAAS